MLSDTNKSNPSKKIGDRHIKKIEEVSKLSTDLFKKNKEKIKKKNHTIQEKTTKKIS